MTAGTYETTFGTAPAKVQPDVGPAWHDALVQGFAGHAKALHSLAQRYVSSVVAEEIVQDAFAHLAAHPERFDPERGGLVCYLSMQVRCRALDRLRSEMSRRRREERDLHQASGAGYDLEHEVWVMARAELVRVALTALPAGERQAIELAYYSGLTYREVAERLGQAEGTVKSRIRRGLGRLRATLDGVIDPL